MTKLTLWSWGAIAFLGAVLAVVSWLAWPRLAAEPPRALQLRDFDVCVLTDREGIGAEPAARTWANLQQLARQSEVRVSYLTVLGEQTQANAELFVATQVQRRCAVVVAVGQVQANAARSLAGAYPAVAFFSVESDADAAGIAAQVRPRVPAA